MQFDAQASAWQEKLVEINEENLKGAQAWIRDIKVRRKLVLGEKEKRSGYKCLRNCFELHGWPWLHIDICFTYKGRVNPIFLVNI